MNTLTNADGSNASVRFYLQYSGSTPTAADLAACAGAAASVWVGTVFAVLHESWTNIDVRAVDLTTDTSAEAEVSDSFTGGLTGGRLPSSTSVVVSQVDGRRYRGGHSRVYIPAGDTTKLLDDRTWTSTFVSDTAGDYSDVVGGAASAIWAGGGVFTQVVVSWYLGNTVVTRGTPPRAHNVPTYRPVPLVLPVVTILGRQPVGTQRRRVRVAG